MVFSSVTFLFLFLPVVLGLYFVVPMKFKNPVLLTASLFFYAWGEPAYVILMIVLILINYAAGLLIDFKKSRVILAFSIALNLIILGFYKYADFLIDTLNVFLPWNIPALDLALPIGISFYTFQAMSYLIDLYRGDSRLQRNILDFATYISLFPQLIAGPIVRIRSIEEQLHFRTHTLEGFAQGARRFIIGLAKKVLIANNVGMVWDSISASDFTQLPALSAWIGVAAFAIQIYFDFSGYSDMAIGLGKMFGFEFPENFRHPYESKSITEFWRRWHISLGTWFREYVYIPLGGNKKGLKRQLINIAIVWFLTGLWHGASWNFVLWGLYFAVFLVMEKWFLKDLFEKLPVYISHIYTVIVLMFSWVLFSVDNIGDIFKYYAAMLGFSAGGFANTASIYLLSNNILFFAAAAIGMTSIPAMLAKDILRIRYKEGDSEHLGMQDSVPLKAVIIENAWLAVLLVVCTGFIVASSYNPFLYFRF